jgi:hypothetical protein
LFQRIAVGLVVCIGLVGASPLPAVGSNQPEPVTQTGRIFVDAPDFPAVDESTMPALPPELTALKAQAAQAAQPAASLTPANHVSRLSTDQVAKLELSNGKVITNREGLVEVLLGDRILGMGDAVLPSGTEVVGFGSRLGAAPAGPGERYFGWCSYIAMQGGWAPAGLHVCARDHPYVVGIGGIAVVTASFFVGLMLGMAIGELEGAAAGAAVGVALGFLITVVALAIAWWHTADNGDVNIYLPNYTMLPPFGGSAMWVYTQHWFWMPYVCRAEEWVNQYYYVFEEPSWC